MEGSLECPLTGATGPYWADIPEMWSRNEMIVADNFIFILVHFLNFFFIPLICRVGTLSQCYFEIVDIFNRICLKYVFKNQCGFILAGDIMIGWEVKNILLIFFSLRIVKFSALLS